MHRIFFLLAMVTIIAAEPASESVGGGDGGGDGGSGSWLMILIMVAIFVPFLFMMRGQRKEQKKQQQLINEVKVGDQIITIGGLHGKVVTVGDQTLDVEIAKDVVMTINRGALRTKNAE